jgi:hypothetical protein
MAEIPEISATAAIDNTRGQRPHGGDRPAATPQTPVTPDPRGGQSSEIARTAESGKPTAPPDTPQNSGANGLQTAQDSVSVSISPAAERAISVLNTVSEVGPQSTTSAGSGQALGQALGDTAPGQAARRDDAPPQGASIEAAPADRADAANADPRATNQQASTENDRAGNDGNSQSEASRTIGQVVDIFA